MNKKYIRYLINIIHILFFATLFLAVTICYGDYNEFDTEEFLKRVRDEHRWSDFEVEKFSQLISIDELETLLDDSYWDISYIALRALTFKDEAKREHFIMILNRTDFTGYECSHVTDLLDMVGITRDPLYLRKLEKLLIDTAVIPNTKMAAISAISKIPGEQSWKILRESTTNDFPIVRWAAARAISGRWDKPAFDVLLSLTKDNNSTVREIVAEALGMFGDICTLADLITLCEDEDMEVRETAAWALGNLRDSRAINALQRLIETSGKETFITMEAHDALRKISGGPRTLSNEEMVQNEKIKELNNQFLETISLGMMYSGSIDDNTRQATEQKAGEIISSIAEIYTQFPNILIYRMRKDCESTRDAASIPWIIALLYGPIIEMIAEDAIDWSVYIGDQTEGRVFRSYAMGYTNGETLVKLLPVLKDICINDEEHLCLRRSLLREICRMHTEEAGQVLEELNLKLDQPELKKIAEGSLERRKQNE